MRLPLLFLVIFSCFVVFCAPVKAQEYASHVQRSDLTDLARQFVTRMEKANNKVNSYLTQTGRTEADDLETISRMPDGEILLMEIYLTKKIKVLDSVLAQVENKKLLISFRDFLTALDFPIDYNEETATYSGWYIREHMPFTFNTSTGEVNSFAGGFRMSADVMMDGNDILVPFGELGSWFGFTLRPKVGRLIIFLDSPMPLPVMERIKRQERFMQTQRTQPASFPLRKEDEHKMVGIPAIDVATRSEFTRYGDNAGNANSVKDRKRHNATIRTASDFAYGTLTTLTQVNNEDRVTNARVNYKKESPTPDLLGPLKARKYEIGDLLTPRIPLARGQKQEMGVSVTNADPLYRGLRSSTTITGDSFSGWDVELYRNQSVVGFQTVGDDGRYLFENVDLFSSDNNFRLVFYGPQGEIREETLYIPVDNDRLAESGAIYDVSLTMDSTQAYRKNKIEDEDRGSPQLRALYEMPLGKNSALSLGLRAGQEDGEQNAYLHTGLSTTVAQALVNANASADKDGEMAAELVVRRDFGKHQLRNELFWSTDKYELDDTPQASRKVFSEELRGNGPIPHFPGTKSTYNFGAEYSIDSNDDSFINASLGFNTAWKRFTVGQQYVYDTNSKSSDDNFHSISTATGAFGKNRLRLLSDYEIKPNSELDRVIASLNHRINYDLNVEGSVERLFPEGLTRYTAQANWQAGFARISPSISYDTEGEVRAYLNTRFGITHEPNLNDVRLSETGLIGTGGLSAFVFFDANGDNIFNEGDEPIPEAIIRLPQNGGYQKTDEKGVAFFRSLLEQKRTDVVLDVDSLKDPFWVPGADDASLLPRSGYVAEMQFPVHMGGEVDGTVYLQEGEDKRPLKNILVHLYDMDGKKALSEGTGPDGFFLFSPVPPGRYFLMIDPASAQYHKLAAPVPKEINIGYDGTIIYAANIFAGKADSDASYAIVTGDDYQDFLAMNEHVGANQMLTDHAIVLNLGEYNSRLLMGLVWYRLQSRYGSILRGTELLVPPEESYAAMDSGKHSLRVLLLEKGLEEAGQKCRALVARGLACKVELLGTGFGRQASADEAGMPPAGG